MAFMLAFLFVISILGIGWIVSLIVGIIRSEITCRRITIYREDRDGNLVERRPR